VLLNLGIVTDLILILWKKKYFSSTKYIGDPNTYCTSEYIQIETFSSGIQMALFGRHIVLSIGNLMRIIFPKLGHFIYFFI
jgi:hypothetical protein